MDSIGFFGLVFVGLDLVERNCEVKVETSERFLICGGLVKVDFLLANVLGHHSKKERKKKTQKQNVKKFENFEDKELKWTKEGEREREKHQKYDLYV